MKKVKYLLIIFISIFLFDVKVFALTSDLLVSSESVNVGESFTVTVKTTSVAAWNIHVNSTGLVKDCVINEVDVTENALDTNKDFSVTCTATGEGTIKLNLSGDVTSASNGTAVNLSGTKEVVVKKNNKSNINETEVPPTLDNFFNYIIVMIIGVIGFLSCFVIFKKRNS